MSHVRHELAEELPEHKDRIHELKTTDAYVARQFDAFHDVNREIHQAKAAGLNIADDHHEVLKCNRLRLKGELFGMLQIR